MLFDSAALASLGDIWSDEVLIASERVCATRSCMASCFVPVDGIDDAPVDGRGDMPVDGSDDVLTDSNERAWAEGDGCSEDSDGVPSDGDACECRNESARDVRACDRCEVVVLSLTLLDWSTDDDCDTRESGVCDG